MKELAIDIETYSTESLPDCGVYRYVESPDFCVLLFAYSVDRGPVKVVDIASGESLPLGVRLALTDPTVLKTAYNAAFERICLSKYLGHDDYLDPAQWECTMVRAAQMGFPLGLAACADALHITEGKMQEGHALIRYFSCPDRNGHRHLPSDAPEKWATFKSYSRRDVEVEQAIRRKVCLFDEPEAERALYIVDQRINDRGVLIDRTMVSHAAQFDEEIKQGLLQEARDLTGLDNPNSPAQIKDYIGRQTGLTVTALNKKSLDDLAHDLRYWPKCVRLLGIRRELGKTSNKKYQAMLTCVCKDNRLHGLLQIYGAARTGRWAGRLVQVQNLPQNHLDDIDTARQIVRRGDLDEFLQNYAKPTQALSELIRTAFIAPEGHTLHVCDFSAIEARVIAWLAGEKWVLDVFRQGGDIYCATASQMFGVPVEKHGQNAELRQKGKVAVLALGYGGGPAALEAMGGAKLGLSQREEEEIVRLWRRSNPHIVNLWSTLERAVIVAMQTGKVVPAHRGINAAKIMGGLCIGLPSGRALYYPRASVTETADGRAIIEYEGTNQTTKKWERIRTYGGRLTENIVQALARDILANVILRAESLGLHIVFHVHDEIIVEAPLTTPLQAVETLFSQPPSWAKDLPLKGAGYSTPYYLKD